MPPAATSAPPRRVLEVVTADGARLAVEHIPAAPPVRGAAWLAHAIMANRRSLDRPRGAGLGSALAARGVEVYLADLRGHGDSAKGSPGTRDWSYHDVVRADLPALTGFVRARHPGLGIAGLGHSLAGHAALAWLGLPEHAEADRPPLDALVTIAANIWLRQHEPSLAAWARKRATMAGFAAIAGLLGRLPAVRLGMGSDDVPRRFVRELHGFVRANSWRSPEGLDYLAGTARIRAPVLAVLGRGDALLCREVCGRRFHARLPRCEVRAYGAAEVGFDPGHMELVTDARARPIWEDVAGWLAAALAGGRTA